MARNIELNSKHEEPKKFKIRRKNTIKKAVNRDNSLLKPSTDLSEFSKRLFYSIKNENKQLSNSDNYLLNLLCSEYDIYLDSMTKLDKYGFVHNGKKSPYYSILKQSIDEITKLSNDLSLTPKNRINADFHKQDNEDPIKQAVEDGGHD